VILSRFVSLAGGADATIAVISTASSLGLEAGERYRAIFGGLGVRKVRPLHAVTRPQANDDGAVRAVRDATGVFLTGGNQLRLSAVVAGTRIGDAIHRANDRGAVLAGTSAGASAMASHMMAFGRPGESPKNRMAQLAAGLGILPGLVIDQHFSQRGRIGRLLSVIAHSPSLLGIGLDEDTCAVVYPDRSMEVLGRGAVTVIDGSRVVTDVHQAKGFKPIMVSGAIVHSLPSGTWFHLRSRSLLAEPAGAEREASG
jgi:cyanophycinase